MKVLSKILGVLILLGLVMAVAAFFMGLDIAGLRGFFNDDEAYGEMLTETTSETVDTINIDVETRHIIVHMVESDDISVTYYAHESRDTWTFGVESGVYTIKQKEKVVFFNFMNYKYVSQEVRSLHLYLPQDVIFTFDLSTSVGDIRLQFDQDTITDDLALSSNTGSVYVKNVSAPSMNLTTNTGSIIVQNATVHGALDAQSNTGSISLTDLSVSALNLDSDTGSITLTRVEATSLIASVDTGRVSITDSEFIDDVDISTSTGGINITHTIASSFDLSTSTGDVRITSTDTSNYRYDLRTSTGTIRINGDNQGNRHSTSTGAILVKIYVSTGDITISTTL